MKRKNMTRNALFTSIISLLLCVSMLVGTTFAWFTDSVASGVNTIASGNLDVELYHSNKEDQNEKVNSTTVLFDDVKLWEPGAVAYENFVVANEGTLALKYQMALNALNATETPEGKTLADVLQVAVVKGGFDGGREAAHALQNYTSLSTFALSGVLDGKTTSETETKTKSDIYGVVIYWRPDTDHTDGNYDNEFNVKGGLTIDLGISLFATQQMHEDDSFGSDYDEDLWENALMVTNASELALAIENVEDGGMIALGADLTFNKENGHDWQDGYIDGFYYEGDKSFTINLNGKTITDDGSINDYLLNFKNAGSKPNTITIKNGTLEATSSAYCAISTSNSSTQTMTINLENVKVTGNKSDGSVVKARAGVVLNVKAGTVITGKNNYLGIENWNATVNVYDGARIYMNGTSSYNGCLIGVGGNGVANVYGGYGKGVSGGLIAMTSGGTINVSGGEWIANTDGTYANSNKSVLIAQSDKQYNSGAGNAVVNVTGGTFKGGYNCYGNAVGDAQINISGGNFNADPATYVIDGYKAAESAGKYFVVSESIGSVVSTAAELQTALDNATGDYTIVLNDDITGNVTVLQKVGVNIVIDGKGHKYDGTIYLEGGTQGNSPETLTIKNVNFVANEAKDFISADDAKTIGKRYAHNVTVENCTFTGVEGADVVAMRYRQTYNMKVIDCTATKLHSLMWATGGTGITIENATVTNSQNGVSFGTSTNVEVKNSRIEAVEAYGYGVRADASGAYDLTIENSTIKADAPILLRKATGAYNASVKNTTLTSDKGHTILVTASDYEEGKEMTPATGDLNVGVYTNENGITYVSDPTVPGEKALYVVPAEYAAPTLEIPEGVTSIGNYAFSNNSNVKTVVLPSTVEDLGRGFDTSSVEKVVLNEGLKKISSRAFKETTALKEVVISSTVEEITDNAFQKSGIKEIVIPANVKTIGETAFGASLIEKVTIEGNTSIQGYAFRGCTKLREVYLNGNDVTFIASTLNGRNSCWFCNGESNNPNTSEITFHVVNETVAARVKAAMGADTGKVKILVNGVPYEG